MRTNHPRDGEFHGAEASWEIEKTCKMQAPTEKKANNKKLILLLEKLKQHYFFKK